MSAEPVGVVREILSRFGLPVAAVAGIVPSVARLSDGVNAAWIERYRGP